MSPLLQSTLVETDALLKTVVVSLVAGLGLTFVYSLAIFGAARFSEMRRDDRVLAATLSGALMVTALIVCLAAVVLGIYVMAQKD